MDHIDGWEEMEKKAITDAYDARRRDPGHPAMVAEAAKRGFRPADLFEIRYGDMWELHCWRGELWMCSAPPEGVK